jgi:superfamily II DNA or RNA helicase
MAHDIIDNSTVKLADVLKEKLSVSITGHFAVGWLFLTGLKEIKDGIENLNKLEILIGSKTNRETAEVMLLSKKYDEAVSDSLKKLEYLPDYQIKKILDEEASSLIERISFIEPTPENIDFIRWFSEKLREKKIEIKIYPYQPLHAKLYLLDFRDTRHGEGIAYVGSSNLSLSGLNLNTELNVAVSGDENHKTLAEWFRERWAKSKDFTALAQDALENSWALINEVKPDEVTPFRVYLRILHEIFSYQEREEIKKEKKYGQVELYDYQVDAVIDVYQKLQEHNGVFLADVPGIGKTYMSSALLAHLEEEGKRAIVICPPKLIEQWRDVLSDFGVGTARVFSLGKLEDILNDEKLMEREIVLIDEAHHFRNPDTFRYQDLQLICENKKVILVGATPQNLSIWDLYHQIKLFIPEDLDHKFRIDPPDMKEFFKQCERGSADLEDLMNQIMVRRTRSNILEYYGGNMKFPERKGPFRVDYDIDKVYPGGLYRKLSGLVENLKFARYDIGSYVKDKARFSPDELQRLKVAGGNLRKLMKIILFRRLESSIPAFRETVDLMYKSHSVFLDALKKNIILAGEEAEEIIDELRAGEEIGNIKIPQTKYNADWFEKVDLKKDINGDRKIFEEMYDSVKGLTAANDDKLIKLTALLKSPQIVDKKTIIFTQFSATAKYLGAELAKNFKNVEFVSQDTGQVIIKAKRFAPKANRYKVKPGEEINLLVSTELLSEGLNLQDGQVVINYELHWNPVRIIQRIGRIDRIGSGYEEIHVYNFFPQEEIEASINVEKKVMKRIEEIIRRFGGDEKTITMGEKTVKKKLFEVYTENNKSLEEEEFRSRAGHFTMEWKKLRDKYPKEYRKALDLPRMVTCGMVNKRVNDAVAVFCRADDYYKLLLANQNGEIIEKNDWKILEFLECLPEEKAVPLLKFHLSILEKIRNDFEVEVNKREREKQALEEIKRQIIKKLERFKRGRTEKFKNRIDGLIEKIRLMKLTVAERRNLRKIIRRHGLLPEILVEEMEKTIEKAKFEPEKQIEKKYAQMILSESFQGKNA